jgi:hypothetical protein
MAFGGKAPARPQAPSQSREIAAAIAAGSDREPVPGMMGRRHKLFCANAQACLQSAKRSKSDRERAALIELAQGWSRLADQHAANARLKSLT